MKKKYDKFVLCAIISGMTFDTYMEEMYNEVVVKTAIAKEIDKITAR